VSALTAETVVGGVYEVIYARVAPHRTAELPGLLQPLLYIAVQCSHAMGGTPSERRGSP